MNIHEKAMDSMFNDLDDMESEKMFGKKAPADANGGVDITISVIPKGEEAAGDTHEEMPEDVPEMNKGGQVDCYSDGGMVEDPDDSKLPPFLRKKKKTA